MKTYTIFLYLFILASICWGRKFIVPDEFSSIHSALGEADEGDTVYVKNGIYKEILALVDNVVLLGEDKEKTIIKGDRRHPVVFGADGAVLKNFTITNGRFGIISKYAMPTITGNIIKNNRKAGILAINTLPEIYDNEIINNAKFGIFLHRVIGDRSSIHENSIIGHGNSGIYCNSQTDALIVGNIFVNNRRYGVFTRDSSDTRILENTFVKNRFPFNLLAIIDNNNRIVESLRDTTIHIEPRNTLQTNFGIPGGCHPFDVNRIHVPNERNCLRSYGIRRYCEWLDERMCIAPISTYPDGITSYQRNEYWDAAVNFGKTLCLFPNFTYNAKALYLLANSFIEMGLLNCAKSTLERGLVRYSTSSYIVRYNLGYLKIAFLEEDMGKFDQYYKQLQDYCLPEDIQRDVNHIKKLSEEYKNSFKDTLIQQSVIPDSIINELALFESELLTNIMAKPILKRIEAIKEYRNQYDKRYRLIYEQLYSAKLAELKF